MKKIVGWGFASLGALLALGFIFLGILTDSTTGMRDAAIANVRSRAQAITARPSPPTTRGEPSATRLAVSSGDCGEQLERWGVAVSADSAHSQLIRHPTELERQAERAGAFLNGGYGDPTKVPGDDWVAMRAYVDSRVAYLSALKLFALSYDPACGFFTRSKMARREYEWLVLSMELALAVSEKDYALAVEDLTCMTALRCTSCFSVAPYLTRPQYAGLIVDALRAGVVEDDRWAHILRLVHGRREQDFMGKYVAGYPHAPASEVRHEASLIEQGIRSLVRKIQEPSLNNDAARFAPLMEVLVELSLEPYYKAEPALQSLADDYGLSSQFPQSYRSISAAHRSVVDIVYRAFPENAMAQLQLDMISLAIALDRHRVRHGRYPESLAEAAELFGENISANPLTGGPYDYELADGAYRLGVEFHEQTFLLMLNRIADGIWIGPDGFE